MYEAPPSWQGQLNITYHIMQHSSSKLVWWWSTSASLHGCVYLLLNLKLVHALLHNRLSSSTPTHSHSHHTLTHSHPHSHTHTTHLHTHNPHSHSHDSVTYMEVNNRQVEKFIYDVTATIYGGVEPGRTEFSHNYIFRPLVAPSLCSRHCSPGPSGF